MEESVTILIVDDDKCVLETIEWTLADEGYNVVTAPNGVEAIARLESEHIDLILADISMPRMNGYQLHANVVENREWVSIPFIFLTARALDSDVRFGKELGADDYVTKPFRREDLLSTVRGRLRRSQQLRRARPAQCEDELSFGQLRVDFARHRVWVDEHSIQLSAREFRLLSCLALAQGRVVPLTEMVQATHGLDTDRREAGSLLRPLVRSVRRKLGYCAGQMGCIENVRGVGYRLLALAEEDRDWESGS